jgi:hypothetical protein
MPEQATQPRTAPKLDKFTVEFGDIYCSSQFHINTLNLKVNGRWDTAKLNERPGGMPDIGSALKGMPTIPGNRMEVNPKARHIKIYDPVAGNKALVDRIKRAIREGRLRNVERAAEAVPDERTLDDDEFKTLLFELRRMKDECNSIMVVGHLPTKAEIDALPGDELFDPGWKSANYPTYKYEFKEWARRID